MHQYFSLPTYILIVSLVIFFLLVMLCLDEKYWGEIIKMMTLTFVSLFAGGFGLFDERAAAGRREAMPAIIFFAVAGVILFFILIFTIVDATKDGVYWRGPDLNRFEIAIILIPIFACIVLVYQSPRVPSPEVISDPSVAFIRVAENKFQELSKPTPENKEFWGMTDFKIFGRPNLFGFNEARAIMISDLPRNFEVTIPFWLEGTAANGKPRKEKREIVFFVIEQPEDEWQVDYFELQEGVPLTSGEQVRVWLLWSSIGPVLVLISIFTNDVVGDLVNMILPRWVTAGCIVILVYSLPALLAGLLAYVFFHSIRAVILGGLLFLILDLILLAKLMTEKRKRWLQDLI